MTIAEIESTLQSLTKRHPNLDEEMLVALLTSSGWEDKAIKDTVGVFRFFRKKNIPLASKVQTEVVQENSNNAPSAILTEAKNSNNTPQVLTPITISQEVPKQTTPAPQVQPDNSAQVPAMVYYTGTGEEEEALPVVVDDGKETFKRPETKPVVKPTPPVQPVVEEVKKVDKIEVAEEVQKKNPIQVKEIPQDTKEPVWVIDKITPIVKEAPVVVEKNVIPEPQSLVIPSTEARPVTLVAEPPENLPLKPFDSAPHVWSFSKYKELFHRDTKPEEIETTPEKHEEKKEEGESVVTKIKIKRTGFDGEDEGLIFLTGVTLFIILILLAYMYSNGRI